MTDGDRVNCQRLVVNSASSDYSVGVLFGQISFT